MYYYRNRYYNPNIGRFITRDPIGIAGGVNLYGYVNNNPVNWVDPFGLAAIRTRPLENPITRWLADRYYGKEDVRGEHWQIFYEDKTNSGYLGDNPKTNLPIIGPDDPNNISKYYNTRAGDLDDEMMKQAEKQVTERWLKDFKEGKRKYNYPGNDCQTYILEVLGEYNKSKDKKKK